MSSFNGLAYLNFSFLLIEYYFVLVSFIFDGISVLRRFYSPTNEVYFNEPLF